MRSPVAFILLCCLPVFVAAQSSHRMSLLSRWDNDSLPSLGTQQYSEIHGWYDAVKQKEYALLCSIDSIYFFDVTHPQQPVLCDVEAGRSSNCRNRSIVTYNNRAYAVADQGNSSLQIFDLRYLPDSVQKVYDNDSLCSRAHTLTVDTLKARLYLNHNKRPHPQNGQTITEAMTVLSLQIPESPVYLGTLQPPIIDGTPLFDFVHDAFAWNDTVFCSTGANGLFIYDYRNANQPKLIRALTEYPEKGFCHSPVYDPQRKLISFTDESAGTAVKLYSTTNFSNLQQRSLFRSNTGALAHRSYFKGNTLWVAYYHDGVRAFDIRNPDNVVPLAWYDTFQESSYNGILGCWGVYPYLPSGNILASDMTNGLFILKPDTTTGIKDIILKKSIQVYPNPAKDILNIELGILAPYVSTIVIYNRWGQEIYHSSGPFQKKNEIDTDNISEGVYYLFIEGDKLRKTLSVVILK
jgi:choice-of-anchor B domain-containing protein